MQDIFLEQLKRTREGKIASPTPRTLCGATVTELHDAYWNCHGVEVVRRGQKHSPKASSIYLLLESKSLALFPMDKVALRERGTVEVILRHEDAGASDDLIRADASGRFLRFERRYTDGPCAVASAWVTSDAKVSEDWRRSSDSFAALGPKVSRPRFLHVGRMFPAATEDGEDAFAKFLVETWRRPDAIFPGFKALRANVWGQDSIDDGARVIGSVWIGRGWTLRADDRIVGPAILWDRAEGKAREGTVRRGLLSGSFADCQWDHAMPARRPDSPAKRAFDVCFALVALLLTLPFYPFILLAILIEDGFPLFFGQKREGRGGREFTVWKFRSMCREAESMRHEVAHRDVADGPQIFVPGDPRLTYVGFVLRALQVDEWPQFFNVLWGDMSVVGPRPLAFEENQWCPSWREARLSVRPGITGLWQVLRTRRAGLDFQEWIKYDNHYVENASLAFDLKIISMSILLLLRGPLARERMRVAGERIVKRVDGPQTSSLEELGSAAVQTRSLNVDGR